MQVSSLNRLLTQSFLKYFQHDGNSIEFACHTRKLCVQLFAWGTGSSESVRVCLAPRLPIVFFGARQI